MWLGRKKSYSNFFFWLKVLGFRNTHILSIIRKLLHQMFTCIPEYITIMLLAMRQGYQPSAMNSFPSGQRTTNALKTVLLSLYWGHKTALSPSAGGHSLCEMPRPVKQEGMSWIRSDHRQTERLSPGICLRIGISQTSFQAENTKQPN